MSAVVFLAVQQAVEASPGGSLESSGGSEPTVHSHVAILPRTASALKLGKRRSLPKVPFTSTDPVNSCLSTTLSHGL